MDQSFKTSASRQISGIFMMRFLYTLIFSLLLPLELISLERSKGSPLPNFVLIVVDDAGLMDFGGYGGEVSTPHVTALGDAGVRFSNYHTSPLCAPTRAMLLTGVDNHLTGVGTIPEVVTPEQKQTRGYSMQFLPEIKTIADKLTAVGYRTYMTGKWHLGGEGRSLPDQHGFEESFIFDASGADNWEEKSYMPYYGEIPWYENGARASLPKDFYSSKFIVDKMIEYLDQNGQQPFFSYLAFQAVHIPVQVSPEYRDRYEGIYSGGWEQLREDRFQKAKKVGLISEDAELVPQPAEFRSWSQLNESEKYYYEQAMMANAGMLESMDANIGRLISYLRETGRFDNTIFIVTSDNGPEFNHPTSSALFNAWRLANGYHDDPERAGEFRSVTSIGPEWALAAATPGNLFKFYASEGSLRVPLIVSGDGFLQEGFNPALLFVSDITPSILEMANVPKDVQTTGVTMTGRSFVPVLSGELERIYEPDESSFIEVSGNKAVFRGNYKLTFNTLPHGNARWELFDIKKDPGESLDLSQQFPELKAIMIEEYESYASNFNVVAVPKDFNPLLQVGLTTMNRLMVRNSIYVFVFLIGLLALLTSIVLWARGKRRAV